MIKSGARLALLQQPTKFEPLINLRSATALGTASDRLPPPLDSKPEHPRGIATQEQLRCVRIESERGETGYSGGGD